MKNVDLLLNRQRNNRVYVQVGFDGAFALADQVSLVGFEPMQAQPVFLRIDGDGAKTQFGAARKIRVAISPRFNARSFFIFQRIGLK